MINRGFLFCLLFFSYSIVSAQEASHPLDPLTSDEMRKVVSILRSSGTISGHELFNIINLKEPPKKEVLAYKPGQPFRREAFVSLFDFARVGMMEAIVDLNAGKVSSLKHIPNVIGMGLAA